MSTRKKASTVAPYSNTTDGSDAELVGVGGLLEQLHVFIAALDGWTIPDTSDERLGRVVHTDAAGPALSAEARALSSRFGQAKEALERKHRRRIDGGSEDSEHGAFTYQVGWGGIHYSLHAAIKDVLERLAAPTQRSQAERTENTSGVPSDSAFHRDDIVPTATVHAFEAAAKVLRAVAAGVAVVDPFAVLYPGVAGPRVEAAQVVCTPAKAVRAKEPVNAKPRRPRNLDEARHWLITRTRLAKALGLGNPVWLKKQWPLQRVPPAWSAPPGCGHSSLYPLGVLYD